ncbi:hypothetical protein ACLB1Q_23285 [Escherichia coli]
MKSDSTGAATDDHNKRVELYKQAQVVMHNQAPALIIAHSTVLGPDHERS